MILDKTGGYYTLQNFLLLLQGDPYPFLAALVGLVSFLTISFLVARKDISRTAMWKGLAWTYFIITIFFFVTQQFPMFLRFKEIGIYDIANGLLLNVAIYIGIASYLFSFKTNNKIWRAVLFLMLITLLVDFSTAILFPTNYLNTHLPYRWSFLSPTFGDTFYFWFLSFPALFIIYKLSKGEYISKPSK